MCEYNFFLFRYTIDMEVSPQLPRPPDPLNQYKKEDVKLLTDNRFTIIASILFIGMAIIVGVLVIKRIEIRDKGTVERINFRSTLTTTPTPNEWETHVSSSGKYSIKYPGHANILENQIVSVDGVVVDSENTLSIVLANAPGFVIAISHPTVTVVLTEDSLKNLVDGMSWCNLSTVQEEEYVLDGEKALLYKDTNCGPSGLSVIYSLHNDIFYSIKIESGQSFQEIGNDVNEILSTLRFIEEETAQ